PRQPRLDPSSQGGCMTTPTTMMSADFRGANAPRTHFWRTQMKVVSAVSKNNSKKSPNSKKSSNAPQKNPGTAARTATEKRHDAENACQASRRHAATGS